MIVGSILLINEENFIKQTEQPNLPASTVQSPN